MMNEPLELGRETDIQEILELEIAAEAVWGALEVLAQHRGDLEARLDLVEPFDQLLAHMMEFRVEASGDILPFVRHLTAELATFTEHMGPERESELGVALARAMSILHPLRARVRDSSVDEDALWRRAQSTSQPRGRERRPSRPLGPEAPRSRGDRRSSPRAALDVDIGVHSDSNFYTGFTEDISEGGLFVATYQEVSIGTQLTLSFVLPDGRHIVAVGEVRWTRTQESDMAPGIGVSFRELSASDKEAIERFMKHRQPLFYDE